MRIESIHKGDLISIGDKKFQTVEVWEDFKFEEEKERKILDLGLVEIGRNKMTITHRLIYYFDSKTLTIRDLISNAEMEIKNEGIRKIPS